jgi:hypothetical protein
MSAIRLTEEEKIKIGKQCCNCGIQEDLQYHHIVPLTFGGNNIVSNICCLCYNCHSKIHFGKTKNINHSEATKAGLQKAKERGVQLGRKKGDKLITKKFLESKPLIIKLNCSFNGCLTDKETYEQIGLAKNTFYKYKSIIRAEMENNNESRNESSNS